MLDTTTISPCLHANTTELIQAVRLIGGTGGQLEKIVSPGERVLFWASPIAKLEISSLLYGTIQTERVSCQNLLVKTPHVLS